MTGTPRLSVREIAGVGIDAGLTWMGGLGYLVVWSTVHMLGYAWLDGTPQGAVPSGQVGALSDHLGHRIRQHANRRGVRPESISVVVGASVQLEARRRTPRRWRR